VLLLPICDTGKGVVACAELAEDSRGDGVVSVPESDMGWLLWPLCIWAWCEYGHQWEL
jgi:hypothetical protein